MAQTALLSDGHTLYHHEYSAVTSLPDQLSALPQIQSPAAGVSFLVHNGLFFYKQRVKASFQIAKPHQASFALIKGLIEFHRGSAFTFSYNREARNIEVDLDQIALPVLEAFLRHVDILLHKEIVFKSALKQVLQFEEEYKAKKEAAYHTFLNLR